MKSELLQKLLKEKKYKEMVKSFDANEHQVQNDNLNIFESLPGTAIVSQREDFYTLSPDYQVGLDDEVVISHEPFELTKNLNDASIENIDIQIDEEYKKKLLHPYQ